MRRMAWLLVLTILIPYFGCRWQHHVATPPPTSPSIRYTPATPTPLSSPMVTAAPPKASPSPLLLSPTPSPIPTPTPSPTPSPSPSPTPQNPLWAYTIDGLRSRKYPGGKIEIIRVLERNPVYTRYAIAYPSDNLRITGVMVVPTGNGPFPVVILNHGYIPPDQYWSGADTANEADYLARRGYLCIAPDFRGWGESDAGSDYFRAGLVIDVLNLISSLSTLPQADPSRVGLWGHSMGGGVVTKVITIDPRVKAAVLYGPVSAYDLDNIQKWGDGLDAARTDPLANVYRLAAHDPHFLRFTSPLFFLAYVTAPVQIHQGSADTVTPPQWAEAIRDGLEQAGKTVEYYEYPGQGHAFQGESWQLFMQRVTTFFDRYLKGEKG